MTTKEFTPEDAPEPAENWEICDLEPWYNGKGYLAVYRGSENGLTAKVAVNCHPNEDYIEISLDEYTDHPDPESRTRRFDVKEPKDKTEETFEDITDAWIKGVSNNEP